MKLKRPYERTNERKALINQTVCPKQTSPKWFSSIQPSDLHVNKTFGFSSNNCGLYEKKSGLRRPAVASSLLLGECQSSLGTDDKAFFALQAGEKQVEEAILKAMQDMFVLVVAYIGGKSICTHRRRFACRKFAGPTGTEKVPSCTKISAEVCKRRKGEKVKS